MARKEGAGSGGDHVLGEQAGSGGVGVDEGDVEDGMLGGVVGWLLAAPEGVFRTVVGFP